MSNLTWFDVLRVGFSPIMVVLVGMAFARLVLFRPGKLKRSRSLAHGFGIFAVNVTGLIVWTVALGFVALWLLSGGK